MGLLASLAVIVVVLGGGKSLWPIGRDACACTDFYFRVIHYPLSLSAAAIP